MLPEPVASDSAAGEPPDPMRVWFRFVRLNRRLTSGMSGVLRDLGLSIPQFDVLSTLTEREGLTQKELALRLYVTKGNVSGLVDRLVEAGLVERRAIPDDRRSHALFLTPAGAKCAHQGIEAQKRYVHGTLGALDEPQLAILERAILDWREALRRAEA